MPDLAIAVAADCSILEFEHGNTWLQRPAHRGRHVRSPPRAVVRRHFSTAGKRTFGMVRKFRFSYVTPNRRTATEITKSMESISTLPGRLMPPLISVERCTEKKNRETGSGFPKRLEIASQAFE